MFAAFLVMLGVFGAFWVGVPAYRQFVAIRAIEKLGGRANMNAVGPKWLRDVVGDDMMRMFDQVDMVSLSGTHATDDTLRQLSGLTDLFSIGLRDTEVTDAGMAHLARMKNLWSINVSGTRVSDVGLMRLMRLPNLTFLNMVDTQVTDESVAELQWAMPELRICQHQAEIDAAAAWSKERLNRMRALAEEARKGESR
jgi:hypothetical protein